MDYMAKTNAESKITKPIEETLWKSANKLHGAVGSSEYKHVVPSKYEVIRKRLFAYEPVTSRNGGKTTTTSLKDSEYIVHQGHIGTLGELRDQIVAGAKPVYDDHSKWLVLGSKCIYEHQADLISTRRHTPKPYGLNLHAGDVLIIFAEDGSLGRVTQYRGIEEGLAFDSSMTLFRPDNEHGAYYLR